LLSGTKVHLFSRFSSIFGKKQIKGKNTPNFNISQVADIQHFAEKLQKRAKKNRKK
jgi:hypothetical protein